MFPCSLKQGSCSLVPYDIFPLFPCSPKPLGDPQVRSEFGALLDRKIHIYSTSIVIGQKSTNQIAQYMVES